MATPPRKRDGEAAISGGGAAFLPILWAGLLSPLRPSSLCFFIVWEPALPKGGQHDPKEVEAKQPHPHRRRRESSTTEREEEGPPLN